MSTTPYSKIEVRMNQIPAPHPTAHRRRPPYIVTLLIALAFLFPAAAHADPDYSLSFRPNPLTVQTRKSGTVTVTATTIQGPLSTVIIACGTPVPPNSICLYKSQTIDLTTAPSGSIDLYLDTSGFAFVVQNEKVRTGILACALLPFPLFGLLFRRRLNPALRRAATILSATTVAILASAALQGCSGKLPPATAPGTYTLPIAANMNGAIKVVNLDVVVTK
jgi:hypothetical protein